MRRIILLIVGICILYSQTYAFNFQYNGSKKTSSCVVNVDRTYYIPGQTYSKTLYDEFWHTGGDKFISTSRTTISLWAPDRSLVSGCNNSAAWIRKSDVAPQNTRVVATAANCTFNKPTNKNNRNVQFVYNIGYSAITQTGPSSVYKEYITTPNFLSNPNNFSSKTYPNYRSVPEGIHGDECFNVELRYCGDGILETGNGEVCDPEDASQIGWGNGGCDTNTCQPINNPVCTSLTVNTTTGEAPTDVAATCTGFKVNTFKIDCGNGQVFTGNGNNSGNQTFTGTCNYTAAGSFTPTCFINDTITANSCRKTVDITSPKVPSIIVDKTDANVFDIDGNVGNDTQSVYQGEEAKFKIRVTNNGSETLKDIQLIDIVETSCATKTTVNLSANNFTNQLNNIVSISVGGLGTHTNSTLEVGEWFEYTCKKSNTQSNYTNIVRSIGTGVTTGTVEDYSDPTAVLVIALPIPEISVDKRDDNPTDLDGNIGGNDSQTVGLTNPAIFRITVENTGEEGLRNIMLTDATSLSCSSNEAVDLVSKNFQNQSNNAVVTISVSGAGNHSDNILQVGEKFTYTCSKANTQESYTNIVDVSGVGIISGDSDTDTDPTEVILVTDPNIQIIKEDANSNDIDGIQFNDTQTVVNGDEAVFHITVKNTGNENLKDITLTDVKATACGTKNNTVVNLSNSYFTNMSDVQVVIHYLVSSPGDHSDNILQVGEEFSYTCSAPDTQSNYTNIVEVGGVGVLTGTVVGGADPSAVIVMDGVYDLALRKTVSTNTPGPYSSGSTVTFDITVYNQGNVDATVKEIVDYIPTGLTLNDLDWVELNGKAYYNPDIILTPGASDKVEITFILNSNTAGTITNYAEIQEDDGNDCDSIPDEDNTNDGTVINDDIGSGCETGGDEDDHDIETITIGDTSVTDVYLVKSLAVGQATTVNIGELVNYVITVYNSGSIVAENQRVEDHFFDASNGGLALVPSADWTGSGGIAEYKELVDVPANDSLSFNISFAITPSATGIVRNLAVVCDEDEIDCTPEPPVCDPLTEDCCDDTDEVGNPEGCVEVEILTPSIKIDKLDANPELDQDNNVGNDSQKVDTGQKAAFSIRVTNDGLLGLDTIMLTDARATNCAGSVTLPNKLSSWISFTTGGVGDKSDGILEPGEWFEYTCEKNNTQNDYTNTAGVTAEAVDTDIQVSDSDTTLIIVTTGGSSGSTYKCESASQSGSTVTCKGNSQVDSFYLKCGSSVLNPVNTSIVGGQGQAEFNCSATAYQCYVYHQENAPIVGKAWRTSSACKGQSTGGSNHCGNAILEESRGEQCDFGSAKNGVGTNACTANCKIKTVTSDCKDTNTCVLTWPNGGGMVFGLSAKSIIGHTQNPLEGMGSISLTNDSDYDMSFEAFCVKRTASDSQVASGVTQYALKGTEEFCTPDISNDVIYAYETITLGDYSVYPNYEGNKDGVSGADYGEATLTASVKSNGVSYYHAYFAQKADTRIAKPAIVTTGGGTSYVKSTTTSDVAKITNNAPGNTNFVGVSATDAATGISSNVESLDGTDTAAITVITDEQDVYEQAVENDSLDSSSATASLEKYNGLDNVFIIKGANLVTSSLSGLNSLGKGRTYIIEDADLIVDSDVNANKNIAFVVKNGDIVVNDTVRNMDGTYVVLGAGEIRGQASADQLVVNGSLYGNIDKLVANRYYISDDTSGQLSVGIIVSFGSSLFSRPAPLVSQFVGEYLASTKVAK